ncbi:hypothetical protein WBJ53_15895 [Spirosoma sp. SC4-14]|uniref:hypothetical protein n=1 Tax=Spirosoma sp. SC4-14 TaxID=3128900 RepID=UPI0030D4F79B
MSNDEFYIGYQPNAPAGIARSMRLIVGILLTDLLLIAFALTRFEQGFSTSQFEYGTLTEVEGQLLRSPVPTLRVLLGKDANGQNVYKSILLVNFLKFGAESLLQAYTQKGVSESESLVRLSGTLLYYDGLTVLELTDQEQSLLSIKKTASPLPPLQKTILGTVKLTGEIVDPKCYFGAMKPGESKPHRDCAIRCISGGIPPVFVLKNQEGVATYLFLTDQQGHAINDRILKFVAVPIQVSGTLQRINEWMVLQIDPATIRLASDQ